MLLLLLFCVTLRSLTKIDETDSTPRAAQVARGAIRSVTVQAAIYHYLEHCGRVAPPSSTAARIERRALALVVAAAAGALVAWRLRI